VLDLLIAFVPSLLLGSMSLLLVALGGDTRQQTMGELGGGFLFALVATAVIRPGWTTTDLVVSFLSGVLLGVGIQWQIKAFRSIGVSRTMPISTGGQLVFISLGGIVLFGEWRHGAALPVGLVALVLIIVGIAMTAWREKETGSEAPVPASTPGAGVAGNQAGTTVDWPRGARELVISTFGLVTYLLLVRWFGIDGTTALFPQAVGYLLTGLVLTFPRFSPEFGPTDTRWSVATGRQLVPGLMWGAAILIMQVSAARVGVAVGFTLSQMGVVIATLGGIWLLGETRTRKELTRSLIGCALVVVGAVLIGVAKSLDAA